MRVAWTIDDAPTIAGGDGGVRADPERMDRIRETLEAKGIRHCVAFVIGSHAEGAEAPLRRWLDAGYELGNHTHEHTAASAVGPDATLASVARCDALLAGVGAFDAGRTRWFRFPYLDRGKDPEDRARLLDGLRDLGYREAPASFDTHDHRYEVPLASAIAAADRTRQSVIGRRYVRAAVWVARLAALTRPGIPQITYGHFGEVGDLFAGDLVDAYRDRLGARFVSLGEASSDEVYEVFVADPRPNGIVLPPPGGLPGRVVRAVCRRLPQRGLDDGPRFPFLHP